MPVLDPSALALECDVVLLDHAVDGAAAAAEPLGRLADVAAGCANGVEQLLAFVGTVLGADPIDALVEFGKQLP